jgi:26S proteasome regulatory subunit N2
LIHAGSSAGDKGQYLCDALRNAGTNEIVQHGACLGLGLVSMATQNMAFYDEV